MNESLLFCRNLALECRNICDMLRLNEDVSSQQVNLDKSTILFNPNTTSEVKGEIVDILNVGAIKGIDK